MVLEAVAVEIRTVGMTDEDEEEMAIVTGVSVVGKARWALKLSSW